MLTVMAKETYYCLLLLNICTNFTEGFLKNSQYLTSFYYPSGHQDIHIWLHREETANFLLSPTVELLPRTIGCRKILLFNHTAELSFRIQLWNYQVASAAHQVLAMKCGQHRDCPEVTSWRSIQPIPFKKVRLVYKDSSLISEESQKLRLDTGWRNTLWDTSFNYSFVIHLDDWNTCQKLARTMRSNPEVYTSKLELEGVIGSIKFQKLSSEDNEAQKWPINVYRRSFSGSYLTGILLQYDNDGISDLKSECLEPYPRGLNIQIGTKAADIAAENSSGFMVYYDRSPLERYFNRKSVGEYTPLFEKVYFNGHHGFNITNQEFVATTPGPYLFQLAGQTEIWGFSWEIQHLFKSELKKTHPFKVQRGGACCETLVSTVLWVLEVGDVMFAYGADCLKPKVSLDDSPPRSADPNEPNDNLINKFSPPIPTPKSKLRFQDAFGTLLRIEEYFGISIRSFPPKPRPEYEKQKKDTWLGSELSRIGIVSWTIQCLIYTSYIGQSLYYIRAAFGEIPLFSLPSAQLMTKLIISLQGFFNLWFFLIYSKPFRVLLGNLNEFRLEKMHKKIRAITRASIVPIFLWPLLIFANYSSYFIGCSKPPPGAGLLLIIPGGFVNLYCILIPTIAYASMAVFLMCLFEENDQEFRDSLGKDAGLLLQQIYHYFELADDFENFFTHYVMFNITAACFGSGLACLSLPVLFSAHLPSISAIIFIGNFMFLVITFAGLLIPAVLLNEKCRAIKWALMKTDLPSHESDLLRAIQLSDDYHWRITAGKAIPLERGAVLGMISVVTSALVACLQFGLATGYSGFSGNSTSPAVNCTE